MFPGYHNLLRFFAGKILIRDRLTAIPRMNTAIGDGESLGRMAPKRLIVTPSGYVHQAAIKTLDDTVHMGTGKQFLPSDFPATGYTGEPI